MNEKLAFLVKLLNDYNINMEPFVGEKQKGVPSVIEPSFPSASMAAH